MNGRKRRGFTLVELLVVITIIGMLMAMLLPAIQAARESGRRAQCLNNQRQLALALLGYDSARRELPGFLNYLRPDSDNNEIVTTWIVPLLPYLERNDLWNVFHSDGRFSADDTQYSVELALLSCPSDPPTSGNHGPPLAYRINCGMWDGGTIEPGGG